MREHANTRTITGLNPGVEIISIPISFAKLFCTTHSGQTTSSTLVLSHMDLKCWRGLLIIQTPETLPDPLKKVSAG